MRTLLLLLLVGACGPQPVRPTVGNVATASTVLDLAWDVAGDTPTVAWSPDGRRLAVAHAQRYGGGPPELGIEVVDVTTDERRFAVRGPAYRPVWLDDATLAYGCTPYDCDEAHGLYRVNADGSGEPTRWFDGGVYHTRAGATPGSVMFYAGWSPRSEADGWFEIAVGEAQPRWIAAGDGQWDDQGGPSWRPPAGSPPSQCPSRVGGRSVGLRPGPAAVDVVVTDGAETRRIASSAPWVLESGREVEPCLSPDGNAVVFFAPNRIEVRALD